MPFGRPVEEHMTAQIAAYGRLVADPQTKTTSKGNNMAMTRMAVSLPCNSAQDGRRRYGLACWRLVNRPMRWRNTRRATL